MARLKHYGILGMRWGVRRAGGTRRAVSVGPGVRGAVKEIGGLAKDAAKDDLNKARSLASRFGKAAGKATEQSPDAARASQLKKKPVSKLSNDELKTVITRLQLEKQFKELNTVKVGKGKRFVQTLLINLGAKALSAYARTKVDPQFVSVFEEARKRAQGKS